MNIIKREKAKATYTYSHLVFYMNEILSYQMLLNESFLINVFARFERHAVYSENSLSTDFYFEQYDFQVGY